MSWVRVPLVDRFTVSYAGSEPVAYQPQDGLVEVEQRRLEDFLAAIEGAELAPAPDQSAEPAREEA